MRDSTSSTAPRNSSGSLERSSLASTASRRHPTHIELVELTVGIVRFEYHGRKRGGLCTLYMADEIDTSGAPINVFMSPTKSSSSLTVMLHHHG